ncbi:outer membrane protein assembly factor BamA [Cellulophaga sp. HaHaR_3_176]|uniref:outer membrane protein assembly factor BamA n=1 Tax=Cellulophaga sp. HaHaR_3_176 TaxID=1942464 RepID=UPI001C1FB4FA|nr:outer membrane protein assembly factor BamA [Cellulophaga sp. HaHaR_3_176]QWX84124.1 outer membrane protein assembly factor BamA [Cellulophaga sp. HaHaR_3_176]
MEKQANNLPRNAKKNISYQLVLTTLILFLTSLVGSAQSSSYEEGKKYILAGLTVSGLESYNEQTVKTYTGLRDGQPITVPGEEISSIINKLWGLELFSDISMYITKVEGENIYLELNILERPTLSNVTVYGVKKGKIAEILKDTDLKKGKKITENLIANTKNYLQNKYKKKGFLNTKVTISTAKDTSETNAQSMVMNIKKGSKVKIGSISFEGNEKISDKKLKKALKKTKEKSFKNILKLKRSKYIPEEYEADLVSLIESYAEKGYRDARVISDSIINDGEDLIDINIKVEEGNKYYFGDIDFVGNTVYTDRQLSSLLGLKKGDVYNGVLLKERIEDNTRPDPNDITSAYQNNGYMFSRVTPVEMSASNDTINFEIRIIEGKETFLDHVTIDGNDRTNDHVVFRELRTRPGQKYNKADIIRSIRELGALGFFDAENVKPDVINPDPNAGTVDLNYSLVESGSSQIELQGGYGGGGFIGTLGLSFSNFSIKNLFNGKEYKPVPMGDGQTFALRLQASQTYRVYSLNFSEPWLGGKKPVSFSTSLSRTKQFAFDTSSGFSSFERDPNQTFSITGITFGLAKRVQWPDDYFTISHSVGYQLYEFNNYNLGLFNFGNGNVNSLAYTLGISRRSAGTNPIFPTSGSNFEIKAKFTPPWSLFNGTDYAQLNEDEAALENTSGTEAQRIEQERFKWLEFYKVNFKGDWYTTLAGNRSDKSLVLRTNAEFGFLGSYNAEVGDVPFERFYVGGDGMGNFTLDGRENVQLRGYANNSVTPFNTTTGQQDGAVIYNKFSMELRYPLTLKPSASIYGLVFAEGGNSFNNFKEFNPFEIKRSVGAGLRIFMPAFGLLGIDFGYGFDSDYISGTNEPNGWEVHFIIGQQF